VAELDPDLLQSLEKELAESRKIRSESVQLLEKAQWPVIEPARPEPPEIKPPVLDLLLIPCPPLLGFQRDRGNLPSRPPVQTPKPDLATLASPATSPSKTESPLSGDGILEPADLVEVPVSSA